GTGEKLFSPFIRNTGISFSNKISPSVSLHLGYFRWFSQTSFVGQFSKLGNGYSELSSLEEAKVGDVHYRYDYQFMDASVTYSMVDFRDQEVYLGLGASYAFGKDVLLKGKFRLDPGYEDWLVSYEDKNVSYLGGMMQLGYNYFFFKGRMNAGVSGTVRYYPSLPVQYYTNLNIGYNFSLLKKK